jgi:hypothetical protein
LNEKPDPLQIPDVIRQKTIPGTEILVLSSRLKPFVILSGRPCQSQSKSTIRGPEKCRDAQKASRLCPDLTNGHGMVYTIFIDA